MTIADFPGVGLALWRCGSSSFQVTGVSERLGGRRQQAVPTRFFLPLHLPRHRYPFADGRTCSSRRETLQESGQVMWKITGRNSGGASAFTIDSPFRASSEAVPKLPRMRKSTRTVDV